VFSIDQDLTIRWTDESLPDAANFSTLEELASVADAANFSTLEELASVADAKGWSRRYLEQIWNGFAGAVPFDDCKPIVGKTKNRGFMVRKIWNAIQRLAPAGLRIESAGKVEKPKLATKVVKKSVKAKRAKPVMEKKQRADAGNSTKDKALQLMLRKTGVTAAELNERLGWSETSAAMLVQWVKLITRNGIKSIAVEVNGSGERVYKAA